MKMIRLVAAGAALLTLAAGTAADAQAWGPPPPPPPPYGYAPPPPPPPPSWRYGEYGWNAPGYRYRGYRPRCWTEYRHHGWERVRVCA